MNGVSQFLMPGDFGTKRRRFTQALLCALFAILLAVLLAGSASAATIKFKVKVGRTKYLKGEQNQITFKNTSRITYKFKSSNKKVFRVSQSGLIKAVGKGSAVLTVKGVWQKGQKKQTWTRQVTINVFSCKLSKTSLTLAQSQSKTLKVKGETLNRKLTWYSETPEICSVNAEGKVTALREGDGIACVHVGAQLVLRCAVKVTVTSLSASSIKLWVNGTTTYGSVDLAAEFYRDQATGKGITYTIQDETVGYMSGNIYYATAKGSNQITAYSGAYKKVFNINQSLWAAHRGYSAEYPENSIDAFMGAVMAGAGLIETDLRVTKDGEIVCIHDNDISGMTNAPSGTLVSRNTLETIRSYSITKGNGISKLTVKQIPTLEEYLKICSQFRIIAILDIKTLGREVNDPQQEATAAKIMDLLKKYSLADRSLLICNNPALLQIFQSVNGTSIPMAPYKDSDLNKFYPYNFQNFYTSYTLTPFGVFTMTNARS